jgi:hypothetical protein
MARFPPLEWRVHYIQYVQLLIPPVTVDYYAFPIVVKKACIPIRMYLLPRWFTEEELCLLDAEDDDIDRLLAFKLRQQPMNLEPGYDEDAGKEMMKNNKILNVQSTIELEGSSEGRSEVLEAYKL